MEFHYEDNSGLPSQGYSLSANQQRKLPDFNPNQQTHHEMNHKKSGPLLSFP
jgi:hypothetical protein